MTSWKRGAILALLALLLLTACSSGGQKPKPEPRPTSPPVIAPTPTPTAPAPTKGELKDKPNVVEVLADDMRWDDLRFAPNLRKLVAAKGLFMANMFSNYPLCCPARAAFFSGQLPHNHHVYTVSPPYGYRAFDDRRTIATSMKEAGYNTGFIGKYLNNYGSDEALAPKLQWQAKPPAQRTGKMPRVQSQYYVPAGWDEWRAATQGNFCRPACGGAYHYFQYGWSENGVPTASKKGRYSSDVMGQQARQLVDEFAQKRRRDKNPFFLSVNFVAPHTGGAPVAADPQKAAFRAQDCSVEGPAAPPYAYEAPEVRAITRGAGVLSKGGTEADVSDKPGKWSTFPKLTKACEEAVRADTVMRAAAVYAMDKNIGTLIEKLKREHEWKRTVFVFWSDNGYFQGEHRRKSGKIVGYEPVLRVPLLITGPAMRGGAKDGVLGSEDRYSPMDVPDLTATLLDLAGAEPPHPADGHSRKQVLLKGDTAWDEPVLYEAAIGSYRTPGDRREDTAFRHERDGLRDPRTAIGLRTARYYYVRYDSTEREIYDLKRDPQQWHNLAQEPKWLEKHEQLVQAFDATWEREAYCAGKDCKTDLPPTLRTSAQEVQTLTRAWYGAMKRAYWDEER